MYISLFPSLLNQVQAKVAGPFFRLSNITVSVGRSYCQNKMCHFSNSQLRNRNHKLANAVDSRVIAAMLAILTPILVHGRRGKIERLVREQSRTAADDAVDGLEHGRLVPVGPVDGLVPRD